MTLERLIKECTKYKDPSFVFKRCSSHFIIVLQKLKDEIDEDETNGKNDETITEKFKFKSNEMRENVYDKSFAKFRCNGGLLVIDIINTETNEHIKSHVNMFISSSYAKYTSYEVGKIVFPDSFNDDIDSVCASGIHYFLTLKAAYYYDHIEKDGKCLRFYNNGLKAAEWINVNGLYHGIRTDWYLNGKIKSEKEYKNGELTKLVEFKFNGKLERSVLYADGIMTYEHEITG
jgi:hypothetical protein